MSSPVNNPPSNSSSILRVRGREERRGEERRGGEGRGGEGRGGEEGLPNFLSVTVGTHTPSAAWEKNKLGNTCQVYTGEIYRTDMRSETSSLQDTRMCLAWYLIVPVGMRAAVVSSSSQRSAAVIG